jgi:hypothetical protein
MNFFDIKAIWAHPAPVQHVSAAAGPAATAAHDWSIVQGVLMASGAFDKFRELPKRPAPQSLAKRVPPPRRRRPRRPQPRCSRRKYRGSGWRPRSAAAIARRKAKRAAMLKARHAGGRT